VIFAPVQDWIAGRMTRDFAYGPHTGVRRGGQLQQGPARDYGPRGRPLCAGGAKAEWPRPAPRVSGGRFASSLPGRVAPSDSPTADVRLRVQLARATRRAARFARP
jgi:hypothetical protein